MKNITVKQATESEIPILEGILLDTVNWLNEIDQPLWKAEDVVWAVLSKSYQIGDFYIAYLDGEPSGCMAIVDNDPFFWPDVSKGESVMIHKLAVKQNARKAGISDALMDYAKDLAKQRKALTVRLDCHQFRSKLRAFYERHGFVCVGEKTYPDIYNVPKYHTAFYVYQMDTASDQNIHCREATVDDTEQIIQIDYLRRDEKIERAIHQNKCYVAAETSKIVGFAILDYSFFDYGYIDLLIVEETHRRRGVGASLLEYTFQDCTTEKLFTSTNESNNPMRNLLAKAGFSPCGQIDALDEGDPELFFVKRKAKVINKTDIVNGLLNLGVQPGMALEVHSSLSSFGHVDGGANTVIEALMETVGSDGAIVMPSFTISALMKLTDEDKRLGIAEKSRILSEDDLTTNNGLGIIANTFRDRPDTVLGKGTFRVSAWGKDANLHAASGFERIIDSDGYALLLGVDIYRMSSMHYMEDAMPPVIKQKFAPSPEARAKYLESEWMIGGWVPVNKPWYEIQNEAYRMGLIKDGMIGNAKCMLLPVKPVVELYRKALLERPLALYGLEKKMDNIDIIAVREHPEYLERAVDYFSSKWGIAKSIYQDCIANSLTTDSPLPRWYLMMKDNEIIGSYGLIVNDFISRQDLWPWLCAVYIEENERGKALGSRLLEHGRHEAAKLGFPMVYLCTDHIGFYEKYGWRYIGVAYGVSGRETRVYEIESIS